MLNSILTSSMKNMGQYGYVYSFGTSSRVFL